MTPQTPTKQQFHSDSGININPYMTPKSKKPSTHPPPLGKPTHEGISLVDLNYLRMLSILIFQEQK